MEKGRHLVSYADEHVPRSRPLFAGIHVRDGYFPSKSAFLRILLAEGRATKRRRLSFGNHREWRRRENSRDKNYICWRGTSASCTSYENDADLVEVHKEGTKEGKKEGRKESGKNEGRRKERRIEHGENRSRSLR